MLSLSMQSRAAETHFVCDRLSNMSAEADAPHLSTSKLRWCSCLAKIDKT